MSNTATRLRNHNAFFIAYLFVLIPGALLLLSKGKRESFLILNAYHTDWLDNFFIYYTNFGDGLFAIALSLFFFFVLKKRNLGLALLLAYSSTGILAQIIKPLIESPRPQVYFSPEWMPFFIKGVIHTGFSSFPSGHTVTAFAMASVLALYYKSSWMHIVVLLLAVTVGFTRIYLSQHFLLDVLAGSFIGVLGGILCVHWCRNLTDEKLVLKKKA